jgi:hypothetical protein
MPPKPSATELSEVVDSQEPQSPSSSDSGKLVIVDQSLTLAALSADPTPPNVSTNLDKIVLIIVVAGIIVFAAFQINQCVAAYANPSTKSEFGNVSRTFPGIMLCPFSVAQSLTPGFCPLWSPEAVLSFDFGQSIGPGCTLSPLSTMFFNTNVDDASRFLRSASTCSINSDPATNRLFFAAASKDNGCGFTEFSQQVVVKNSAKPFTTKCAPGGCLYCNSFTPPNVKCIAFDPSSFEMASSTNPALNPICNPMKEVRANSRDSLNMDFAHFGIFSPAAFGAYSYSGLIPQPLAPPVGGLPNPFITAPSSLSIFTSQLQAQGMNPNPGSTAAAQIFESSKVFNLNSSIFGGMVAVFYDASKGVPKELDFSGALVNTMSNTVLGSAVLLSTDCYGGSGCKQVERAPISGTITSQVDISFANAALQQTTNSTSQSMSIQVSPIAQTGFGPASSKFVLSLSFSSSLSVVTTPVVGLTILTTISIIVSTAATLWGSQEKIKEGVIKVTAKVKEFLEKRAAK